MKKKSRLKRNPQSGQGLMEYIIISSLVGIFCLVAVKQFGSVVHKRISSMKQSIVKSIPLES
ncbi:MAG: hypothetical protein KAG61_06665 [Bacteriovoracaceae bacterium]|nr:hypothetical protein [Bacteriovoracaceae bacterium]